MITELTFKLTLKDRLFKEGSLILTGPVLGDSDLYHVVQIRLAGFHCIVTFVYLETQLVLSTLKVWEC